MFEWDEDKNASNKKKHGIGFEEAIEVFNDPNCLELFDRIHSSELEDRYICIGDIGGLLIVFVVYEDRRGVVRVISARRAEPKEEMAYYEHLERTFERD